MKKSNLVFLTIVIVMILGAIVGNLSSKQDVVEQESIYYSVETQESVKDLNEPSRDLMEACYQIQEEYDLTNDELYNIVDMLYLSMQD